MNYFSIKLFLFLLLTAVFTSCSRSNKDSNSESGENQEIKAEWKDCINCGMPTNDFKHWQVMTFIGGESVPFCAPRCMFIHLSDSSNNAAASVTKLEVTDYYTTQKIDGRSAFFVTGSDKTSPMGKDFVPFANQEDAKTFMKEHHGKEIYSFDEITKEVVERELK